MQVKQEKFSYKFLNREGREVLLCQGQKPRSAIFFDQNGVNDSGPNYAKCEKRLVEEFELPPKTGTFEVPESPEIPILIDYFKRICWLKDSRWKKLALRRTKKTKTKDEHEIIVYNRQIRLLHVKYHETNYAIAKQVKISRKKVHGILKQYSNLSEGDPVIDAIPVQRRRNQHKYANEKMIIEYIKNFASHPGFDRSITVREMAQSLEAHFAPATFKLTKTSALMQQAGLRFKRVKINVCKRGFETISLQINTHISFVLQTLFLRIN